MNFCNLFFIFALSWLSFNSIKAQPFFSSKALSFSASYGVGKIQYYVDGLPVYILNADQEAVEYSPSWSFRLDKIFYLNQTFDFSLGFSHLTITEKTQNTALPSWFEPSETNLTQGFFHLIPKVNIKIPNDYFIANLGLRIGTANFIGNYYARPTSHSLGELHADIDLEIGTILRLNKNFSIEAIWIHGLTKYEYLISMPIVSITYFKYHSIQLGIRYKIHEAKKK